MKQNEHGKSESSTHHQGSKTSGRNMNAKRRQNEMASDMGHKSSCRVLFAPSVFSLALYRNESVPGSDILELRAS